MSDARQITITVGQVTLDAELNDSPCADRIYEALPIEATANTWGEEIYFRIPVVAEIADDAREDVAVGELGYWPEGQAFCIFFGRTPASRPPGDPRAASEVNPIGRVLGDATALRDAADGAVVILAAADLA